MRLIDNLKDFSLDLADYVKAKDQEVEQLKEEIFRRKQVASSLQDEIFTLKAVIDKGKEGEHDYQEEIVKLGSENASLRESLKLIETTHGIDPDTIMCELAEKFRIILFDVVGMYTELKKEVDGDAQRTD